MDQTSLIQRILAGESRAYEELVKTYQHMVFTLCLRVLRNPRMRKRLRRMHS